MFGGCHGVTALHSLTNCFNNLIHNIISCVRAGKLANVLTQFGLHRLVVLQFEQGWDEFLFRVSVAHHDGCFGIDELLGILSLMVLGSGG